MRFDVLTLFRVARRLDRAGFRRLSKIAWGLQIPTFGSSIPPRATLGIGVRVGYRGIGIVIHERAVVGDGCLISHQVTIGGRGGHYDVPILEDGVVVGAGAKILGPITVGSHAKIGANAVVVHDVPPGATVVASPCILIDTAEVGR